MVPGPSLHACGPPLSPLPAPGARSRALLARARAARGPRCPAELESVAGGGVRACCQRAPAEASLAWQGVACPTPPRPSPKHAGPHLGPPAGKKTKEQLEGTASCSLARLQAPAAARSHPRVPAPMVKPRLPHPCLSSCSSRLLRPPRLRGGDPAGFPSKSPGPRGAMQLDGLSHQLGILEALQGLRAGFHRALHLPQALLGALGRELQGGSPFEELFEQLG